MSTNCCLLWRYDFLCIDWGLFLKSGVTGFLVLYGVHYDLMMIDAVDNDG